MLFPNDVMYTKDHVWVLIEGNTAKVGITDYAQDQMGSASLIDLPEVGNQIEAGEVLAEIEASLENAEVICPLSGEVVEVNEELDYSPEMLNDDPYGTWIAELALSDPEEAEDLIDADEYEDYVI